MPLIIDREEEARILADGFDTMIPVSITVPLTGDAEICGYASIEAELRTFVSEWGHDPIGKKALARLRELLAPHFERWGYSDDSRHFDRSGCRYERKAEDGPLPADAGFAVRLTPGKIYRSALTYDINTLLDEGHIVCAVLNGDTVVSAAITQEPYEKGTDAEIGTETAPACRGKGYAAACVAALTNTLLGEGSGHVIYRCFSDNERSRRIAQKNGFTETERFFYYVLRKDPKKEGGVTGYAI